MSGSSWQGKAEVESFLRNNVADISSLLDIGPGRGVYGLMARWVGIKCVMAVEIFESYAEIYNYRYIYNTWVIGDFSKIVLPDADCVILGDVLEHLPKQDALKTFARICQQFRHVILSIPIGPWPQGPSEGNIHETHMSTWTFKELADGPCAGFQYKEWFRQTNVGVFMR